MGRYGGLGVSAVIGLAAVCMFSALPFPTGPISFRLTRNYGDRLTMNFLFASLRLCGIFLFLTLTAAAQIPAPKDTLGFTPGDDRKLASWASIVDYFKKLDAASDRVKFEEIGKSTMGAPFVYATISSPENLQDLDRYKRMNAELADPRIMARRR